jgi:hypothetical protein
MVVVADMAEDMAATAAAEDMAVMVAAAAAMVVVVAAMAVVAAMDGELRDQLSKPDPINL